MNITIIRRLVLAVLAVFVAALFAGCGRSSAPDPSLPTGTETVTFHVTDMGKRLALM
ncbi:MAG: hypothetical protein ACKV2Q_35345 [Planctomycetaceae bacterium]